MLAATVAAAAVTGPTITEPRCARQTDSSAPLMVNSTIAILYPLHIPAKIAKTVVQGRTMQNQSANENLSTAATTIAKKEYLGCADIGRHCKVQADAAAKVARFLWLASNGGTNLSRIEG